MSHSEVGFQVAYPFAQLHAMIVLQRFLELVRPLFLTFPTFDIHNFLVSTMGVMVSLVFLILFLPLYLCTIVST